VRLSLGIFNFASRKMFSQGIILADTKFVFGLDEKGEIFLIDEVLTPDSSRFWDVIDYREGFSPPSYDKQILRDYLETAGWNKPPPPPVIPQDITLVYIFYALPCFSLTNSSL
jgi:phosphoribosylaminoimidazole-succinocarboxamide synthase